VHFAGLRKRLEEGGKSTMGVLNVYLSAPLNVFLRKSSGGDDSPFTLKD
jgi:hypothetical protein